MHEKVSHEKVHEHAGPTLLRRLCAFQRGAAQVTKVFSEVLSQVHGRHGTTALKRAKPFALAAAPSYGFLVASTKAASGAVTTVEKLMGPSGTREPRG
jgi:hypothetical protein